ncbi:MAG: hypothetical protein HQL44_16175 [Alphaproteobacteria bacterium]|nr:hypothetical protein [Alphaproteobacteria bacterium]
MGLAGWIIASMALLIACLCFLFCASLRDASWFAKFKEAASAFHYSLSLPVAVVFALFTLVEGKAALGPVIDALSSNVANLSQSVKTVGETLADVSTPRDFAAIMDQKKAAEDQARLAMASRDTSSPAVEPTLPVVESSGWLYFGTQAYGQVTSQFFAQSKIPSVGDTISPLEDLNIRTSEPRKISEGVWVRGDVVDYVKKGGKVKVIQEFAAIPTHMGEGYKYIWLKVKKLPEKKEPTK